MLRALLLSPLNRLLKGESWAADMLKPHAGKGAELSVGSLALRFQVTDDGLVEGLAAEVEPAVTIALPAGALAHLSGGPEQLTRHATIVGDAGFAETISLLLKHLRPDVGAALSPVLGDVLAHRIETGLSRAGTEARRLVQHVQGNIVEYVRDEQGLVVQQDELASWRADMTAAQDELSKLEKRIAQLAAH